MDLYESNEGPTSITESSQEWHILNLLRVSEKDLFETNIQEFRKIQLTESQDGKVRLCKLINEVLRLDPHYSIILVEDLSHLFNDSNFVVQKFALFSIADSFSILFTYIIASNGLVATLAGGAPEPNGASQMSRCRSSEYVPRGAPFNHAAAHNGHKSQDPEAGEREDQLPFSPDNVRVLESFSDLSCIRFMVHTRLLEENFADVNYKSAHALPYLIYNRSGSYSVNLLKALFYELCNYPNYLCGQCATHEHDAECDHRPEQKAPKDGKQAKGGKAAKDKKGAAQNTGARTFDMYDTLYRWHSEAVQLLQVLISSYLVPQGSGSKGSKEFKKDTNARDARNGRVPADKNRQTNEEKLVPCILSSEVACCLITFYPDFYFNAFVDYLVPLLRTQHAPVFENILFRIFSTSTCHSYHHLLLEKVNRYGYGMQLSDVYKLVQTLPSRLRENRRGNMAVVEREDPASREKHFEVTDQLVGSVSVEEPRTNLSRYPAAQLFEFDKEFLKNYKNIKNTQIRINTNFYKHKPAEVAPINYPTPHAESYEGPPEGKGGVKPAEGTRLDGRARELKTVPHDVVAKNEKLYVRLVGCQMIDTVATYQRFLRFDVIAPRVHHFDLLSKFVLNHFLLSDLVQFETRREVLCNMLNYLAEFVLVNQGDVSVLLSSKQLEGMSYGLQALFTYVNLVRDVDLFVQYLSRLSQLVMYCYTTNLAKSLVTYRNKAEDDRFMDLYEKFVNLALTHVCGFLSDLDEFGDFCVHTLSKFVLNLPKVPTRIADLIVFWVDSDQQGNLKLAFSLVSNLLKLSASLVKPDPGTALGPGHLKYASNLVLVRRSIFTVFLSCITSSKPLVASLFLKLVSSPKGLYNTKCNYTLAHLQSAHESLVASLEQLKADSSDLYEDSLYLADRPVWQWPSKLVQLLSEQKKFDLAAFEHTPDSHTDVASDSEDGVNYHLSDDQQVNEDIGAWIEESVALMASPNSLKTSRFINSAVNNLLKSAPKDTEERPKAEDAEEEDDLVIVDEDMEVDGQEAKPDPLKGKMLYLEPMLSCCLKNSRMAFRLASLANSYPGTDFYTNSCKTLARYPKELQLLIKYTDDYSPFVESALEETRKSWCDVLFKFDERGTLEKNLIQLLLAKMRATPEYLIQMAPFLAQDQLDALMLHLFQAQEKDKMVKVLDVIIESPKIALPQHFLYSAYNLPVSSTPSTDRERDQMKLQVSLLDTCIHYCTLGRFSVESAISSLYLIVESFNINFVFGRLLCQFVQKIPLTRKVIVDVIFPKLVQKQCWQDKQLFKGVVISICTLWSQFKDHLLRYVLEMPNSNIKTVLKALHGQHNIADYFKTANVPPSFQAILEDVLAAAPSKPV